MPSFVREDDCSELLRIFLGGGGLLRRGLFVVNLMLKGLNEILSKRMHFFSKASWWWIQIEFTVDTEVSLSKWWNDCVGCVCYFLSCVPDLPESFVLCCAHALKKFKRIRWSLILFLLLVSYYPCGLLSVCHASTFASIVNLTLLCFLGQDLNNYII